jgi:DtxR family Mn-dependent transcriptional regulator
VLTKDRAREDYVKAIYQLGNGEPVSAVNLARYLGVSRAAVTKFRRVLTSDGLAKSATSRTDPIRLTSRGTTLALNMLRRHRLVETFLHQTLGVPIDVLHSQAEAIEHVISDDVTDRLNRFLGNPQSDPHGHPIAGISRARGVDARSVLAHVPTGSRVKVEGIPDRDAAIVRRLVAQRVLPGLVANVVDRNGRSVTLRSAERTHVVDLTAAMSIQVSVQRPKRRD